MRSRRIYTEFSCARTFIVFSCVARVFFCMNYLLFRRNLLTLKLILGSFFFISHQNQLMRCKFNINSSMRLPTTAFVYSRSQSSLHFTPDTYHSISPSAYIAKVIVKRTDEIEREEWKENHYISALGTFENWTLDIVVHDNDKRRRRRHCRDNFHNTINSHVISSESFVSLGRQ